MEYLIRPAHLQDADSIYSFICTLEETFFERGAFEDIYGENIRNSNNIYLVAEAGSQIVGFISCHSQLLLHHGGRVAEIQELFTNPAYRSLGIGSQLLKGAEKLLNEKKCVSIEVTAQLRRKATHQFYEKAGFTYTHKKFVKTPG